MIKRIFVLIFLIGNLNAQTRKIDSLFHLIPSLKQDTSKVNLLNTLSWELGDYDANKAIELSNQAINLSNKLNYFKGAGIAYNTKGNALSMVGKLTDAIACYKTTINIWLRCADTLRIAKAFINLGNAYSEVPDYDSSYSYYNKAIALCIEHHYEKQLSSAYLNLSVLLINHNNYDEALRLLLLSMNLKEKIKDDQGLANVATQISNIYKEQKKYSKAKEYALRSVSIWQELKNPNGLSYAMVGLGMIEFHLNNIGGAQKITKEALSNFIPIDNKLGIATCYLNLGIFSKSKNNFEDAIYNFEKAKQNSINPFILNVFFTASTNLITIYSDKRLFDLAKKNIDTCLKILNKDITKNSVKDYFKNAGSYYFKISDFKNAYLNLNRYDSIKEVLIKDENKVLLNELEARFETKQRIIENQNLRLENIIRSNEKSSIEKQRNYILIFSVFTLFILLGGFVFYKRIKDARSKIATQIKINSAAFEAENIERERIAKELHDDIGQKLSVVKMQLSLTNPDFQKATQIIDSTIEEVRLISHNLIPENLANGIILALERFVEEFNYSNKNIKLKLSLNGILDEKKLDQQQTMAIFRIIQEFVTNSVKYSNANNVYIDFLIDQNKLILKLSDDGIGFNVLEAKKLKGIGLKNIESRVRQLNGKVQMNSIINTGTQFDFEFII